MIRAMRLLSPMMKISLLPMNRLLLTLIILKLRSNQSRNLKLKHWLKKNSINLITQTLDQILNSSKKKWIKLKLMIRSRNKLIKRRKRARKASVRWSKEFWRKKLQLCLKRWLLKVKSLKIKQMMNRNPSKLVTQTWDVMVVMWSLLWV